MREMAESEGTLQAPNKSTRPCPKCDKHEVSYVTWESSCGGYEDYKYTCAGCKHQWWIDGIDS